MKRLFRILGSSLVVAAGFIVGRIIWSELMAEFRSAPVGEAPVVVEHESLALGADVYQNYCVACHLPEGQGNGMQAPLTEATSLDDIDKLLGITLGGSDFLFYTEGAGDGFLEMPTFDYLSDAQIAAVGTYLRERWLETGLAPLTEAQAAAARARWEELR